MCEEDRRTAARPRFRTMPRYSERPRPASPLSDSIDSTEQNDDASDTSTATLTLDEEPTESLQAAPPPQPRRSITSLSNIRRTRSRSPCQTEWRLGSDEPEPDWMLYLRSYHREIRISHSNQCANAAERHRQASWRFACHKCGDCFERVSELYSHEGLLHCQRTSMNYFTGTPYSSGRDR
jgi:hypothetical protein